jgi:hypothetical protein
MVSVLGPLLLKPNVGVLSGVFRGPRSNTPLFSLLWFFIYIMDIIYIYIVIVFL